MNKIHRVKITLEDEIYDELTLIAIETNQARNSLVTTILNLKLDSTRQYLNILERERNYIKHIYKSIMGEETKFENVLIRTYRTLESLAYIQHKKYVKNPDLLKERGRFIEYNLNRIRTGLPLEQPYQSIKKALLLDDELEIQKRIMDIGNQTNLDEILDEGDDESE